MLLYHVHTVHVSLSAEWSIASLNQESPQNNRECPALAPADNRYGVPMYS